MAKGDALSYCLKLLGLRDYFKEELLFKATVKYGESEAIKAVKAIEGYGYLNDERAADNYIRSRLLSGYGPYYISGKLYEKGYGLSVEEIIKRAEAHQIDIEEQIRKLAEKHSFKKSGNAYEDWAKCMRFFINRGYPRQLCDRILKKEDFER